MRRKDRKVRGELSAGSAVAHAEAFRIFRTNLVVGMLDLDRPTLMVTSAQAGEGKTSTAVDLAKALALAGQRVVLVDLDLRHPDVHRQMGAPNEVGAGDVLSSRRTLSECLQFIRVGPKESGDGLYLLSTGSPISNPAELLGKNRTGALLDALAAQADLVIVDTPPVLPVADTLVMGRYIGGALMVVEARRTSINAVRQARDALIRNQTTIVGLVINKLQSKDAPPGYGYGYGYGYGNSSEAALPDGTPEEASVLVDEEAPISDRDERVRANDDTLLPPNGAGDSETLAQGTVRTGLED